MRDTLLILFLISGLAGCGESHSHVDFVEPSDGTTPEETEPAIVVGFSMSRRSRTVSLRRWVRGHEGPR